MRMNNDWPPRTAVMEFWQRMGCETGLGGKNIEDMIVKKPVQMPQKNPFHLP